MSLWVIGGSQARAAGAADRSHDPLYDAGLVLRVDPAGGEVHEVHRGPALYKGASWDGGLLLLCTATGLCWVDPDDGRVVERWTHPWCNDLHHAVRHDGKIYVASTGLDAVLERVGDEVRLHGVLGPIAPPEGDLRGVDRAPHQSHPNHLFAHQGGLFVTRFHQRDAVSVGPPVGGARLGVEVERPHDGVSDGLGAWFTTVDGRLVRVHPQGRHEARLEAPDRTGEPLGWCRGLALQPGAEEAWVGFTRIRATRFRQHLAWARGALRGRQHATRRPTRIARYGCNDGALRGTLALQAHGMDAIFAVLDGPTEEHR